MTPDHFILDTVGVEVGVDRGVFSKILLSKNPKKLYLVDAWKTIKGTDHTTGAEQSTHEAKYKSVSEMFSDEPCVEIIRSWSEDAAKQFDDGSLDWVYIDARHDYEGVTDDLRAWHTKVKESGFLWGDDYRTPDQKHKPRMQVRQAVTDFVNTTDWQFVGLTTEENVNVSKSFFLSKQDAVMQKFKPYLS